jgi:hypothetical protein
VSADAFVPHTGVSVCSHTLPEYPGMS